MQLSQKLKEKFPLIIAIVCGILAIMLLNVYLRRREGEIWQKIKQAQRQAQPPVQQPEQVAVVLLARRNIPPQTPITPDDLQIKEMPVKYIQPGAVTSLDKVIGMISSTPITAGEQILKTKLLTPGKIGKTLSEITPEGKRAVTVSVDNISSLAGLLKPGDYIDVFALISPPAGSEWPDGEKSAPRLVPLFQSVEVLAVGSDFGAFAGVSTKEKTQGSMGVTGTVTLALNPQEAVMLSFVQEHGKIKLALRSSEDGKIEPIGSADWDTLFQYLYPSKKTGLETGQPEPVVEIYRGLKKEVVPLTEEKK
jgi:pilus assembly protein CpaB